MTRRLLVRWFDCECVFELINYHLKKIVKIAYARGAHLKCVIFWYVIVVLIDTLVSRNSTVQIITNTEYCVF